MRWWLFAVLALAGCAAQRDVPAAGGARPGPGGGSGLMGAPPIYAVLGYRQQMELSPGQVAAVDSIADWLDRRNAPLLDSLRARGAERRDGRRRLALRGPEAVSLLQRIGANNAAAVDGVAAALTAEQRDRLCRLFAEQRGERRREDRRPALGRRPRGSARDSLPGRGGGRRLWCAPRTAVYLPGEPRNASDGLFHSELRMELSDSGGAREGRFSFVLDLP